MEAMEAAHGAVTHSDAVKRWRHSYIWPNHLDLSVMMDQRRWRHAVQWNDRATMSHEHDGGYGEAKCHYTWGR